MEIKEDASEDSVFVITCSQGRIVAKQLALIIATRKEFVFESKTEMRGAMSVAAMMEQRVPFAIEKKSYRVG